MKQNFSERIRISSLQWAAGGLCLLVGALLAIAPHQFEFLDRMSVPYLSGLPGWLRLAVLSAVLLFAGSLMFFTAVFSPSRIVAVLNHIFTALVLGGTAWIFLNSDQVIRGINFAVLGGGTLVAGFLPRANKRMKIRFSIDLFFILVAISTVIMGIYLLQVPGDFTSYTYALPEGRVWIYSILFVTGGIILFITYSFRVSRLATWLANLLITLIFLAFLIEATRPGHFWLAVAYYANFGAILLMMPFMVAHADVLGPRSLRTRLALVLALAAALPLIITVAVISSREDRAVKEEAFIRQQDLAHALADGVAYYIGQHRSAVSALAAYPGLSSLQMQDQQNLLQETLRSYADLQGLYLFDTNGQLRASGGPAKGENIQPFMNVRSTGAPSPRIVWPAGGTEPVFLFQAPLPGNGNQPAGFTAAILPVEPLNDYLRRSSGRSSNLVYLIDVSGNRIAPVNGAGEESRPPQADAKIMNSLQVSDTGSLAFTRQTDEYLAGYSRVPGMDWAVVVEMPSAAALENVRLGRDTAFGILLLFLGLTIFMGIGIASWLVSPLRSLVHAARQLASGNMDAPLPHTSIIEVERLSFAFGEMRKRLADRTLQQEHAEQDLRQANARLEQRVDERTSELQRAFEQLSAANRQLNAVLQALPVGVWISDAAGRILLKNEYADKVWGARGQLAERLDDPTRYRGWWPENGQALRPEEWPLAHALSLGEPLVDRVIDILRFDQQRATLVNSAAPIRNAEGKIIGGVAVSQDITQQRMLEKQAQHDRQLAQQKSEELDAIINSMVDAVVVYDASGTPQHANPAAVQAFGFDPLSANHPEIVKRLSIRSPEGDATSPDALPIAQALKGEVIESERMMFTDALGQERHIMASASPIFQGNKLAGAVSVWHDVTALVHAEQALRQSEIRERQRLAELEAIMESVPAVVWIAHDPQCRLVTGNRRSYETLRLGKEQNQSKTGPDLERPTHFRVFREGVELSDEELPLQISAAQGVEVRDYEEEIVFEDGSTLRLYGNVTPLLDESGMPRGAVGAFVDITERVRAEQALRASERQLRTILLSLPVGVWLADATGKIIFGNPAGKQIWAGEKYVGIEEFGVYKGWWAETGEPIQAQDWAAARAIRNGQTSLNEVIEIECFDGTHKIINNSAVPILDDSGAVTGAVILNEDITDRRRADEALRRHEQELRALVENSPDGITRFGKDLQALYLNPASERFYQLVQESLLVNLENGDGSAESFLSLSQAACRKVIQNCKEETLEYSIETSEGLQHFEALFVPEFVENGEVESVLAITRNITERKEAEEAITEYAKQLERSNRELQDFAFIASHDLQEPLRKIQAFGERLQTRYRTTLGEDGIDYIERMRSSASRMQNMINDLLAYSRVTTKAQPFAPVDLNQLVAEVVSDLELHIERTGGQVEVSTLPAVVADEIQMRQLFQNLIGNALKFHRPGQAPRVQVYGKLVQDKELPGTRWVQICIQDNGIGFDDQYLERIFQPFQRLHGRGQYEGTGIGLAICRKIVERHGGSITAESSPEKGSTFIIQLPADQA